MEKVVTYLFLITGLTMAIFAVLLVTARKRTNVSYWLGAFVICSGYAWLYTGLYRATRFHWAPWLLYSDVVVECLAGPFLYRYTKSLVGEASRRLTLRLAPLLPAVAFLAYLILFRPAEKTPAALLLRLDPDYFWNPLFDLLNTIADSYFCCCIILSTATIVRVFRAGSPQFRKAFRGVLAYYIVGFSTVFGFLGGHLLRNDRLLGIALLINGVNTTYLFFLSYRYPEHTHRELRGLNAGIATSAPMTQGLDVKAVLAQLARLIEVERAYREPDISRQSLSTQLGIREYQLSQLLHESLGMTFRGYITRYRLEEAKLLLAEKPGMSILDIAYAVGFNSKSAFNSAFAKETGLSPSEFRKNASKKS